MSAHKVSLMARDRSARGMISRVLAREGAHEDISVFGRIDSRAHTNRDQSRRSPSRKRTVPRFPSARWQYFSTDLPCAGQGRSTVGSAYYEFDAWTSGPADRGASEGAGQWTRVGADADRPARRRSVGQQMTVTKCPIGVAGRSSGGPRHEPTGAASASLTLGRQGPRAAFPSWREYPAHQTRLSRGKGRMGLPEAVSDVKNRGRGHLCHLARRTRPDTTWTGSSVDWTPSGRTST
jgi:hypothetical protein